MLTDLEEGSIFGLSNLSAISYASALTLAGYAPTASIFGSVDEGEGALCEMFFVMNADALYQVVWIPTADDEGSDWVYGIATGTVGNLDMTFDDDTALSIDLLDDGVNYGLVIAYGGDDAAQLFYIDLEQSSATLHVDYLGEIPGYTNISCLTVLYPDEDGTDSIDEMPKELTKFASNVKMEKTAAEKTTVDAIADAAAPMSAEAAAIVEEAADAPMRMTRYTPSTSTKTAPAGGSLNAITAENPSSGEEKDHDIVDTEKNAITLPVYAIDSTNGLTTVTYDATLLTLESVNAKVPVFAHNEKEAGKVIIAFATENSYTGPVAELVFTYDEANESKLDGKIIRLATTEDGDPAAEGAPSEEDPDVNDVEIEIPTEPGPDVPIVPPVELPTTPPTGPAATDGNKPGSTASQPSKDDTPKTGDETPVALLLSMMVLSAAAAGFLVVQKRKRK